MGIGKLILQSLPHLEKAFPGAAFGIRRQETPEGDIIKVVVSARIWTVDPEKALKAFEDEWWLDNCHKAKGNLVFDYEKEDDDER